MSGHADWLAPDWRVPGVGALMTTRLGGASRGPYSTMNVGAAVGDDAAAVAANRALLAQATGAAPVFLRQVHGTRVVEVGSADAGPGAPTHEADAVVTREAGVACIVQAADCLPLLLAAPDGHAVAAAHAGWRGLSAGVVEAAVAALCDVGRCAPGDVAAWLGACIGPDAFEVGKDVLIAFHAAPGHEGARAGPLQGERRRQVACRPARPGPRSAGSGRCDANRRGRMVHRHRRITVLLVPAPTASPAGMAAAVWIAGR